MSRLSKNSRLMIALAFGVLLIAYFFFKIQYVLLAIDLAQGQQVTGPVALAAK